ncbi:pitrilysin family protein [Kordiimonas sp. SCSIO 12610]|uniref:M16 family metallopeptidase n=1 Tax=Kordiimonas sp. SCSIO 12610 TaxID=2829597 RepID=UPI00210ABCFC|nr:insulinase family protein [Kordiimonas sp. SCSIO 12610]UTW55386.1 insulinase family protein [Kordiimonas sp. SCSIO 12610]
MNILRFVAICIWFAIAPSFIVHAVPDWPVEGEGLQVDSNITFGQLDNGMKYAIVANETPKNEATIRLYFRVGSFMEREDEQGIAHFTEHMVFNGTKNIPEGEFTKLLERKGLAFGADVNAFTSADQTVYILALPEVDNDTIDTGFTLMREIASNVLFEQEAIDRERGVILAEKRRSNESATRVFKEQINFLVPGSRMPERLPIGIDETINGVTREQFLDFYCSFYRPEEAFLVFVGDIDVSAIEKRVTDRFSDWKACGPKRELNYIQDNVDLKQDFGLDSKATVLENFQSSVSLNIVAPLEPYIDNKKTRNDGLLHQTALNIISRRFDKLAREDNAPFISKSVGASAFYQEAAIRSISLGISDENWPSALGLIEREFQRALQFGFTQAEIDEQIANYTTSFEYRSTAANKRSTSAIAQMLLSRFHSNAVVTHPNDDLADYLRFREQITPEAVHDIFKDYWSAAPAKYYLQLNQPVDGYKKLVKDKVIAVRVEDLVAPVEETVSRFAYTDFGTPGTVVSKNYDEALGTTKIKFANNLMLNLKKTDFQDNTIQILLRFGRGFTDIPRDLAGIDSLGPFAFTSGGLGKHDIEEINRLHAGQTVSPSLGVGGDTYVMSGAVIPRDVLPQLRLWAAYMVDPAYRPEAYGQYKRVVESIYANASTTPGQVLQNNIGKYIYDDDPRFYLQSKEELLALKVEDFASLIKKARERGAIELTFVGDLDEEAIINAVAQTFGALNEREPNFADYDRKAVSFPATGNDVTISHKGDADQAVVQVYWPTNDASNFEDVIRLNLLSRIIQNRLRDTIREMLGASYAPGAGNSSSSTYDGYGYFVLGSDVKTSDVQSVTDIFYQTIDALKAEDVTEDELLRARKPLIEQIESAKQNNGYWLGLLQSLQSEPESIKWHFDQQSVLEAIIPADLKLVTNKYFDRSRSVAIKVIPEEAVKDIGR